MSKARHLARLAGAALCLGALVAFAAGCGGDDDANGELTTGPGFDGETITLGVITPLSGPVAVIGEPLTQGNRVWFDYLNEEEGGIAGQYQVELTEADSRYESQTAIQQYNRLRDDVSMFVQILGTPIISAALPQLERDDVAAGPATLDSLWVRNPNLVPVGAPYQIQAINSVDFYLNSDEAPDDPTICTFSQDDVYGEAGVEGVEFAAEQLDFEIAQQVTYRTGDDDFTGQIGQLAQADCDMVFLTALPTEAGGILGTAAEAQFAPRWIAQSPTWVQALVESPLQEYLEQRMWVIYEGPEWGDEDVPGMADMIERQERYAPDQQPDIYFTFGYNQARAVTAVLEQAVENGDLSREGILQAIGEVGTISFDGLGGDYEYGPDGDRNPPRENSMMTVDAEAPFGLRAVEVNFTSDAAQAFDFENQE